MGAKVRRWVYKCQNPFHIYMHNYTIATVLYESFAQEERGECQRKRKEDRKEDRKERGKEEGGQRGEMERGEKGERRDGKVEELGRGEINSNLHVLAYSKHTYRDWVVDNRILQEPHH